MWKLLMLSAILISACVADKDVFNPVFYSATVRIQPDLPMEFVRVKTGNIVVMKYKTNRVYYLRGKPGEALKFPDGDEYGMARVVRASAKDQTAVLKYMVKSGGHPQ